MARRKRRTGAETPSGNAGPDTRAEPADRTYQRGASRAGPVETSRGTSTEPEASGRAERAERRGPGARLLAAGAVVVGLVVVAVWFGLSNFGDTSIDDRQAEAQFPDELVPVGTRVGERVPSTTYFTLDGEESSLESYEGRPLVVNFWSSTCASCLAEMPEFQTVFDRYSTADDVAFVGLNIGDSESDAKEMVNNLGISYDTGRDTRRAVFPGFGGLGLPTTALVSEEGEILEVRTGPISGQELSELITNVLLT